MEIWDIPCLQEQSAWTCKGDSEVCGNERIRRKAEDSSRKATPTGKEGLLHSAADTSRLSMMTKQATG